MKYQRPLTEPCSSPPMISKQEPLWSSSSVLKSLAKLSRPSMLISSRLPKLFKFQTMVVAFAWANRCSREPKKDLCSAKRAPIRAKCEWLGHKAKVQKSILTLQCAAPSSLIQKVTIHLLRLVAPISIALMKTGPLGKHSHSRTTSPIFQNLSSII